MGEAAGLALPRVVPDTHCDSHAAALEEARRRRAEVTTGAVTRIRKSPYGGMLSLVFRRKPWRGLFEQRAE